ncbi:hypothetical protein HH214_09565 [Mucilaginibacter robiniae]|uniref:DUF3945 domain-containing protein n=1 Tax=Mucilaginibacter robiniae TaxID=2728022 RepID=A0A7L5E371_9SPHI|nr:hypothetical protein [Mucilaginibacter robiniae]QJD96104.1 hypothetical protein HH214_09565 [Mucilaginibacter robiniae]
MNEKNYDYLKNQVKFMGFGEGLDNELKEMIQSQQASFKIEHETTFNQSEVKSVLNFQKSKESDMYFFNSFELTVKPAGNQEALTQTYYVGKENNLTLKERYNMLEGRAVFKEFNKLEQTGEGEKVRFRATDETYQAWTQLNFKQTDENGNFLQRKVFGFDLEKTLANYPVKELDDAYDRARLVASLEKGNQQKATLVTDGKEQTVSLEASPLDKSLKFYDSHMQRLEVRPLQKQGQGQAQSDVSQQQQEKKAETQKQGVADNDQGQKAEKRRNNLRVS